MSKKVAKIFIWALYLGWTFHQNFKVNLPILGRKRSLKIKTIFWDNFLMHKRKLSIFIYTPIKPVQICPPDAVK